MARWQNVSSTEGNAVWQSLQSLPAEEDYSNFNQSIPFELAPNLPTDDGSLVTLPGDSSADASQIANS